MNDPLFISISVPLGSGWTYEFVRIFGFKSWQPIIYRGQLIWAFRSRQTHYHSGMQADDN